MTEQTEKKKSKRLLIGIDLGGTGIKAGILDKDYEILVQTVIPTGKERSYKQIIADMGRMVLGLLKENGYEISDCIGIGIGSPGTVDTKEGVVLYSNNIAWENVPLVQELRQYLPLPIYLNNDANCAALGEVTKGAARGFQNAVFFTLGTGVGGGIIINGEIFEGGHPGGAELGHILNGTEGRRCTCGRLDCLETYASATALIQDARREAEKHTDSLLLKLCGGNLEKMNAKTPFDAAEQGDTCGKMLVDRYRKHLADGIIDIVNIFKPDIVVLGGGVCAQGENLTEPLNEYLQKHCFGADMSYVPEVVIAENGNQAGVIGAASLIPQE